MASSKSSKAAYGGESQSNTISFDPENLVLVEDTAHPLYDERVHLKVDESMVLSIMHNGIIQPITFTKDPESGKPLVVAGRQRVKAAREANKRLRESGNEAKIVLVPGIAKRASNHADLMWIMAAENEIRSGDKPSLRATKMQRMIDKGRSTEEIALSFGIGKQAVQAYLKLLEAPAAVREALDRGEITLTEAKALFGMTPAEAKAKLEEMQAASDGADSAHAKSKARRKAVKKAGMRGKKEIKAKIEETRSSAWKEALAWVLNEEE